MIPIAYRSHTILRDIFVRGRMKPRSSSTKPGQYSWKDLYTAALFENDKKRLMERIEKAQLAIVARRQEIFMTGNENSENDPDERQVLDTALLSLQALANCLASTPREAARSRAAG
jgi:hypothetical protein